MKFKDLFKTLLAVSAVLVLSVHGKSPRRRAEVNLCLPCNGLTRTELVKVQLQGKNRRENVYVDNFQRGLADLLLSVNNSYNVLRTLAPKTHPTKPHRLIKKTLLGKPLKKVRLPKRKMDKFIQRSYAKLTAMTATLNLTSRLNSLLFSSNFDSISSDAFHASCQLYKLNKQLSRKHIKIQVCKRKESMVYPFETDDDELKFMHDVFDKAVRTVEELVSEWKNCRIKTTRKGKTRLNCRSKNGKKGGRKNRKNKNKRKNNKRQKNRGRKQESKTQ